MAGAACGWFALVVYWHRVAVSEPAAEAESLPLPTTQGRIIVRWDG
jgi:hypothetical protein